MSGNFQMAHLRFLVSQDQPNKSEGKKIEEARTGDPNLSSFPSFFFSMLAFLFACPDWKNGISKFISFFSILSQRNLLIASGKGI